jgi:hypothetical protein
MDAAMVARNSSRKASSSANAAELRGFGRLMGMLRQSLPQLPAKAYAQQCCSVWDTSREKKNPPDESGGQRKQLIGT